MKKGGVAVDFSEVDRTITVDLSAFVADARMAVRDGDFEAMAYLLREIKRSPEYRRRAKAYFDHLRTKKRRARPEGSDFALMQKQRYVLALRDHAVKVLRESQCRNPLAEASHQVAEHLRKNGYKGFTQKQVYALKRRISLHGYRK